MRAQITFDAIFALFIAITGIAFISILISPDTSYHSLEIERKSTDALLVSLEQDLSGFAEGNASARLQLESLFSELRARLDVSGIRVSAGDGLLLVGSSSDLSSRKHFIVRAGDEFFVGEIIVWK